MNRDSTPVLEQSELPPSSNNESSSNKGKNRESNKKRTKKTASVGKTRASKRTKK